MPGDYALVDLPFFQEAIMGIQEIADMMEYDLLLCIGSVSYTHLDVYKRQAQQNGRGHQGY